jgi:hypothetical protein
MNFIGNSVQVFYEGYAELFLASGLTVCCLMSYIDAGHWSVWFWTPSDFINSTFAIFTLCILFAMPVTLYMMGKGVLSESFQDRFSFIYEGYRHQFKVTRNFLILYLFKRCSCCLILFVLDGYPQMQLFVFLIFQWMTMVF